MMRQNVEEEWMKEETGSMITTTTGMGVRPETPIADLPTLTDHLREETMSGRNTYRQPFQYGYVW